MLRVLTILVAALAILYGGYWVVGSRAVERGARAALDGLAARGWAVAYDDLSTQGFPSRFDTGIDGLSLTAPDGLGYLAERVEVMALSYRPNEAIVVWPEGQRLVLPGLRVMEEAGGPRLAPADAAADGATEGEALAVGIGNGLRASARVRLGGDLALEAATVEAGGPDPIVVIERPAVEVRADRLVAALRRSVDGPATYDLHLSAGGLGRPDLAAELRLDGRVTLDRPLDRRLAGSPRVESWDLAASSIRVGDGMVSLAGQGAVGADGTVAASLVLTATGWDEVLAAAREAGLIDEGLAVFYARFLRQAAGDGDTAEVPIEIAGGVVSAMGLPFGFLPAIDP